MYLFPDMNFFCGGHDVHDEEKKLSSPFYEINALHFKASFVLFYLLFSLSLSTNRSET